MLELDYPSDAFIAQFARTHRLTPADVLRDIARLVAIHQMTVEARFLNDNCVLCGGVAMRFYGSRRFTVTDTDASYRLDDWDELDLQAALDIEVEDLTIEAGDPAYWQRKNRLTTAQPVEFSEEFSNFRSDRRQRTFKVTVSRRGLIEHLQELLADYGHIVVDEGHHVPAVTTEQVLQSAPARYVTGLTATPYRRDGHHPIIAMQCGPIRHEIDRHTTRSGAKLSLRIVRRDTTFNPAVLPTDAGIQEIYGALATDEQRTELIARDTVKLTTEGRSPLVLTERREHLQQLADRLRDRIPALIELHGDMRPRARRAAIEQLTTTSAETARVVLATGRYIGEGFDDSRLDTLLLAMPIAWKGTVVQYAGRLHRPHPGKHDALVYDYVDTELPVLRRMFAKRLKTYHALGYTLTEMEAFTP